MVLILSGCDRQFMMDTPWNQNRSGITKSKDSSPTFTLARHSLELDFFVFVLGMMCGASRMNAPPRRRFDVPFMQRTLGVNRESPHTYNEIGFQC